MTGAGPCAAAVDEPVAALLERAANRGECIVGAIRMPFCAVMMARSLAFWGPPRGDWVAVVTQWEVALLAVAMAGFVAAFVQAWRGRLTAPWLVASTVADALVCFVSLATNVIWPVPSYAGLLRMPDVGALLMMVFISTLRLTPVAALASGAANLLSLAALVKLDRSLNATQLGYGAPEVTMVVAMVATTAGACWGVAAAARALVRRAALASLRAERARRGLSALLQEHHDVRTLLCAARLHLDLLQGEAAGAGAGHAAALGRVLSELEGFVEAVKGRALSELAVADGAAPVPLPAVLSGVAEALRARFPQVTLGVEALPAATVSIMGGERGLAHVLSGLLLNACEGDGRRAARRVDVTAVREHLHGDGVRIDVRDDGPGFPDQVLATRGAAWITTKQAGSGLGLALAKAVVESSGGHFDLGNGTPRGARVSVWLPAR
jgi:signal transduction histidine kinase